MDGLAIERGHFHARLGANWRESNDLNVFGLLFAYC